MGREPVLSSAKTQRWVKAIHVVSAALWLGALTGMALLGSETASVADRARFGLDRAAYLLHDRVLFGAFIVTLATGLIFALFTKWGFFRHHWLTVKWVLAGTLFAITLWPQSSAVSGMVALADAGVAEMHGLRYSDFARTSLWLAIAQLVVVVAIFFLSAIKPFGKRAREARVNRRVLVWSVVGLGAVGAAAGVFQALQLRAFRALPIAAVTPAGRADGAYRGEASCGYDYEVEARLAGGRLVALRALRNRDAHYAQIAEAVFPRIIAAQRPRVDAITGATTTSRCLMRATQDALDRAPRAETRASPRAAVQGGAGSSDGDDEVPSPSPPATPSVEAMGEADLQAACFQGNMAACDRLGH